MDKQTLIERYNDLLESDGVLRRATYEHLDREMVSADVRFGEKIVPTFLRPFFITDAEDRLIEAAVEIIMRCAGKLLHFFDDDP